MNPKWHFNRRRPCDRARNSSNEAFFTAESLENLSEALVREGIQNSLDAARTTDEHVKDVRVRIAHVQKAPPSAAEIIRECFAPVAGHYEKGLRKSRVEELFDREVGFLVFEDFGTKGLQGDVEEYRLDRAERNAFFSFFRAEGMSAKDEEKIGRWGVGKHVFPTASRLHSMFGLTVREEEPAKVLMGSAVVRIHTLNDTEYHPDAWFGLRNDEEAPVSPVRDATYIQKFEKAFGLLRESRPGLSIVVPSVDERVNLKDLHRGVVKSFFWPILEGQLTVDIETASGSVRLDAEKVTADLDILSEEDRPLIGLASWASSLKPANHVDLVQPSNKKPTWAAVGSELLPESKLSEIRSILEKEGRVAIKVPIFVRPKEDRSKERWSYFRVFIENCEGAGRRPVFLREGIVISDVRSSAISGTRAIVVVDHGPLAGLLGDSEGVNHTQWQKDSEKFHGRYVYGPETITFVTRSFQEIMQRLRGSGKKRIPDLLLDIFYLPDDSESEGEEEKKNKKRRRKKKIKRESSARRYRVDKFSVKGGFSIIPAEVPLEAKQLPLSLRIKVAYACRGGGALKSWEPDDFKIGTPPVRIEEKQGLVVLKESGNEIEVEIRNPNFKLGVAGFDPKRDLFVDTNEIKSANGNHP